MPINITPNPGAKKTTKRLGRGTGNGRGRTCGKGNKGQKARNGGGVRPGFEGGQMPLYRRIPKRGFKNTNKIFFNIVNVAVFNIFSDGDTVDVETLKNKGLIKHNTRPVKVLGDGDFKVKNLKVKVNSVTETARKKIEGLQGSVELI